MPTEASFTTRELNLVSLRCASSFISPLRWTEPTSGLYEINIVGKELLGPLSEEIPNGKIWRESTYGFLNCMLDCNISWTHPVFNGPVIRVFNICRAAYLHFLDRLGFKGTDLSEKLSHQLDPTTALDLYRLCFLLAGDNEKRVNIQTEVLAFLKRYRCKGSSESKSAVFIDLAVQFDGFPDGDTAKDIILEHVAQNWGKYRIALNAKADADSKDSRHGKVAMREVLEDHGLFLGRVLMHSALNLETT
jgi:hypothetical protein